MKVSRYSASSAVSGAGLLLALAIATVPAAAGLVDSFAREAGGALLDQVGKALPAVRPSPHPFPAAANFAACERQFPPGAVLSLAVVDPVWIPYALCSHGFAVLYSGRSKTPLLSIERLDRRSLALAREQQRVEEFYPDTRLPSGLRSELVDFRGSRLDRGHIAAAGNRQDDESMVQSFALSNIVPQDPTNNRQVWAKVESDVRKFARRAQGNVFVFTGPLFRGAVSTVWVNKVWVPSHLFKLVYDEASGRSWAYVLPNTADARVVTPMDYEQFVRLTGWKVLPERR